MSMRDVTPNFQSFAGLPDPEREAAAYADVPAKRLIAWFVDSAIIAGLVLIAVPFTLFSALFFLPLLWLVVGLTYRIWSLISLSATPGMRLMAIELRNHRGERLEPAEAVGHTLIYSVAVSFVLPALVSIGCILGTARGQSLSDLALGTAMVNRAA